MINLSNEMINSITSQYGDPYLKYAFMWYYPLKLHKKSEISTFNMIKYMVCGMNNYKYSYSYESFLKGKKDEYN